MTIVSASASRRKCRAVRWDNQRPRLLWGVPAEPSSTRRRPLADSAPARSLGVSGKGSSKPRLTSRLRRRTLRPHAIPCLVSQRRFVLDSKAFRAICARHCHDCVANGSEPLLTFKRPPTYTPRSPPRLVGLAFRGPPRHEAKLGSQEERRAWVASSWRGGRTECLPLLHRICITKVNILLIFLS